MAKVLVVDDHRDTLRYMSLLLRQEGFAVETAATLGEAAGWMVAESFDLLLTDMNLPDGDGCLLIPHVRLTPRMRAIAVTGYSAGEDIQRYRDAGFHAVLTKPVAPADLIREMQALLTGTDDPATAAPWPAHA